MNRWIFLLIILSSSIVKAQFNSPQRSKIIRTSSTAIDIDTLSIVPGSVLVQSLEGKPIDSNWYAIDYGKSVLLWKGVGEMDLKLSYKVFPILFSRKYFHKDVKDLERQAIDNRKFTYTPPVANNTLFNFDGLNKSGSISRGIMFGNNQNLSVNSNMVLQMAGKIGSDIDVLAAISDDNLPIQPEGNTQQLNEFDRVFIQLKKDSTTLTAGDYELRKPNSYFMNFFKRTQGGMLSHNFVTKTGTKFSSTLAAAVAKGRSTRNVIAGQEGNQGPYLLTGNNAETFIVVIAGTERVYLDGILVTRGQDRDYIIDYNTAQITFTSRQVITQNTRIIVEFEYSDKNYSRSLTYFNQQIEGQKASFRLNFYSEKDNKNQPFLQTLNDQQKQFLSGVGGNISQAFYPNVTEVPYSTSEILYEQLISPSGQTYYRYSTDPQLAKFRLGFSYVGANKGNYRFNASAAANGRVYEFIEPISGIPQGDYEPITLLVTPKLLQMLTVAGDYNPSKSTSLTTEIALSNQNLNLFSSQSEAGKTGYGIRLKGENATKVGSKGLKLKSFGNYEYVTKLFTPLERYRAIEFTRDFNLDGLVAPSDEHLINTNIQLFKSQQQNISYGFNAFIRNEDYDGFLHKVSARYKPKKYNLNYDASLLDANSSINKGKFFKQYLDLSRAITKSFETGFVLDQQHNKTSDNQTGNLTGSSFSWQVYKFYVQSNAEQKNKIKLDYSYRIDELPIASSLIRSSVSNTFSAGMDLTNNVNSLLSLNAGYRKTDYTAAFSNANEANLVGRVDYTLNALKGFLNSNFYYEVGNGQEPRRNLTYLEVLPGQGLYAWNDYNNNGVKELNEFEIARFSDQAKYIRIFTNTTEFVRTNFTGINHSIRITPSAIIKPNKGFGKFLTKLSDQLSYKIDRKILSTSGLDAYNPFQTNIDAANLVSLNSFFRNTLFFNRNNPNYGIDFNMQSDGNKIFLTNGFDTRKKQEAGLRLRSSPVRSTNVNLTANFGQKDYQSELFVERNYQISYLEILPELNWQLNNDFRQSFLGTYAQQKNKIGAGAEQNRNISIATETRYNILRKGLITGRISFIKNNFSGDSNSTIGYEMLAGLQEGSNITWGLGLQRNIGAGIQLNLNYEGRKSSTVNPVHTGNMQVRAFF